jgi:hypothetical protein
MVMLMIEIRSNYIKKKLFWVSVKITVKIAANPYLARVFH